MRCLKASKVLSYPLSSPYLIKNLKRIAYRLELWIAMGQVCNYLYLPYDGSHTLFPNTYLLQDRLGHLEPALWVYT